MTTLPEIKIDCCIECGEPFSTNNVHTIDGAYETQQSGLCEDCFDEIFRGEEE
jgi:hypothetical protein